MKRFSHKWCRALGLTVVLFPVALLADVGTPWTQVPTHEGPSILRRIANMQTEHRERIRCWRSFSQVVDETAFQVPDSPALRSECSAVGDGEFELSYRGDVDAIVDFLSDRVYTQISIPAGPDVRDPQVEAPFALPSPPWTQFTVFQGKSCRSYFPNQPAGADKTGSVPRYAGLPTNLNQLTYRGHWFESAFASLEGLFDPRQCFGGNGAASAYIRLAGDMWRRQILSESPTDDLFVLEVRSTRDGRQYRFSTIDRDIPGAPIPQRRSTWIVAESAGYQLIRCQTVRVEDGVELFSARVTFAAHEDIPLPEEFELRVHDPSLYGYTFRRTVSFRDHQRRQTVPGETFSLAKYEVNRRHQDQRFGTTSTPQPGKSRPTREVLDTEMWDKAGFRYRQTTSSAAMNAEPQFMAIGPPLVGRSLLILGGLVCAFAMQLRRPTFSDSDNDERTT